MHPWLGCKIGIRLATLPIFWGMSVNPESGELRVEFSVCQKAFRLKDFRVICLKRVEVGINKELGYKSQ